MGLLEQLFGGSRSKKDRQEKGQVPKKEGVKKQLRSEDDFDKQQAALDPTMSSPGRNGESKAKKQQQLPGWKQFMKSTKLSFGRKGKSYGFFDDIASKLYYYGETMQKELIGKKIEYLREIQSLATAWLGSDKSKGSSRVKHVKSLQNGLTTEIARLESECRYSDLSGADFDDSQLDESQSEDGVLGGSLNTLDKVVYQFAVVEKEESGYRKSKDHDPFVGLFKAEKDTDDENDRHRGGEGKAGIPRNDPKFGKRNLAMLEVDRLLGAGVIPPTFAAKHNGKRGIVMKRIEGKTGLSSTKEELADPKVRQSLSKLFLLDEICGQVDRHPGNYMLETANGVIKGVRGIDNDLAFGKDFGVEQIDFGVQFPGARVFTTAGKLHSELEEIDRPFAQRIVQLSQNAETLRAALEGLISEGEIATTLARLDKLAGFLAPLLESSDKRLVTKWV